MKKKVVFEDLIAYTNKWHGDSSARASRSITKSVADVVNDDPTQYNKVTNTFIPYPGNAIIETLGSISTDTVAVKKLVVQLFDNPAVEYPEETQKRVHEQLKVIWKTVQSIANDLDTNSQESDQK